MNKNDNDKIISFLKDKGFVFQSSNIFGGLANSWDYGHLGTLIKENIKNEWKKFFIYSDNNSYLIDSPIMLNTKVWESSGHLKKFTDPIIECLNCNKWYKLENLLQNNKKSINDIECNNCKKIKWSEPKEFNLMFKTNSSKINDEQDLYLRPETAQGIFINFLNVVNTYNPKLPFSIGQIGKSFRNEVTPGNFIFKTKEFEQLEIEYFIDPRNKKENKFNELSTKIEIFLKKIGINLNKIKKIDVPKNELAHYSTKTLDFEFLFPFGKGELLGLANRTDYDLKKHSKNSKIDLVYKDLIKKVDVFPHILEISFGLERLFYAIIVSSFNIENNDKGERIILKMPFNIAPYKLALFPLTHKLDDECKKLLTRIKKELNIPVFYQANGNIGKRYFKADSIGIPYCITFDFESIKNNEIEFTIRERDTKKQTRINFEKLIKIFKIAENGK